MLPQITLALTSTKLGEDSEFGAFEIVLIGFLFVFCVLMVLTLMTSILGKLFARIPVKDSLMLANKESKTPRHKSNPSPAEIQNDFNVDESDPHYIAVIAAAVHCAMSGRKHRIVSIHSSNSNWAAEGRRELLSSHNLR